MGTQASPTGPDLKQGIADTELREGVPLLGQVDGEAVVLVRDGGKVHAVGATCTHYGGPLAEGRVFGGAIHCPWHHACFDLATGKAGGPALAPIACWDVALEGGTSRIGARRESHPVERAEPRSVVIVGGGAAGVACAEAVRAEGHRGAITMVRELFSSHGAGQDEVVFKFANEVEVDQETEIARMQQMLIEL
jgi:nitrite reductase/ring-hydroxylating ferredoxin subunit